MLANIFVVFLSLDVVTVTNSQKDNAVKALIMVITRCCYFGHSIQLCLASIAAIQ